MKIFREDIHFVEQGFKRVRGEQINFYIQKERNKDSQQISLVALFLSLYHFGQACLKVIKSQIFLIINIFSLFFGIALQVSFRDSSLGLLLLGLIGSREGLGISGRR